PLGILRKAEDTFVDELYRAAPSKGAALLSALFPRSYMDTNRTLDDLDPDLLGEPWPEPLAPGVKTRNGQGLIWRICPPDHRIYDRKLGVAEVRNRIDRFWRPYHAKLKEALDARHAEFGRFWHIDCHSMPSVSSVTSPEGAGFVRPDFVLGDRDGTTAAPEFTEFVRQELAGMGYDVKVNDPYKGVELVRAYSDPANGRHSLQIEINRKLYMDEETFRRSDGFAKLQADITRLIDAIIAYAREH
ncbi:MAG TPA: N-formylglutamate amidohydrolase, partial [Alphaproteobacteria bacterium]|nr:N-formylglutamate amidohydrolase [Alphaproteobacteria bacterium]